MIYYLVEDARIVIVRVLHSARDSAAIFGEGREVVGWCLARIKLEAREFRAIQ